MDKKKHYRTKPYKIWPVWLVYVLASVIIQPINYTHFFTITIVVSLILLYYNRKIIC